MKPRDRSCNRSMAEEENNNRIRHHRVVLLQPGLAACRTQECFISFMEDKQTLEDDHL